MKIKEECPIPCWNDCVLTQWSQWSACFKPCSPSGVKKSGVKIRTRHILQQSLNGGVQCPTNLEEEKECDEGHCFSFDWKTNTNG